MRIATAFFCYSLKSVIRKKTVHAEARTVLETLAASAALEKAFSKRLQRPPLVIRSISCDS